MVILLIFLCTMSQIAGDFSPLMLSFDTKDNTEVQK